ncbi:amino-acid N-acetyltransferase [Rothia kristinae]|uniref:Amino-acid N-acetyltransferase n=1 Tax=Rothia kristinae TaxID=37923 RepID=A0A7T3F8B8_9MICC|nr:amino-acid N-acetyltransferase [Rothia kristinae]QPT52829.1 amino-acid N-acetyltransferase [Rothia kristinae]SQC36806.1 Amino-acid acetyltransferase [Rothia kristinae]
MGDDLHLRPARTADARAIGRLVAPYAEQGVLITKETVDYYEAIQEFLVIEAPGVGVAGCAALHVIWEDLAEIRTVAVDPVLTGHGIGRRLVQAQLERARDLGVSRVFCLTFEVEFFRRMGFEVMDEQEGIDPQVFAELLRSKDEGIAEYLDLARVKPNTLGNTRMIRAL